MLLHNLKRSRLAVFILIMPVLAASCYYNKEELLYPGTNPAVNCITVPSSFNADVRPLIMSKCAIPDCHNAATAQGGRVFQNYAQVSAAKDFINTRVVIQKNMPPTGPLSPADINTLRCWIEDGAPNN